MTQVCQSNFYQSESKRFKVKVGVFLVLIQEGNLICLQRKNTGIDDGLYIVPMGVPYLSPQDKAVLNCTTKHEVSAGIFQCQAREPI